MDYTLILKARQCFYPENLNHNPANTIAKAGLHASTPMCYFNDCLRKIGGL